MAEKRREKVSRFEMITGQDSYASQTSQNPETSRRLVALVPQPNGLLMRQSAYPKFYPGSENQPITNIIPFIFNNQGVFERHLFVKFQGIGQIFEFIAGSWVTVPVITTFPSPAIFAREQLMYSTVGGNLHLTDGNNNYLYDGIAKVFVSEGLPIPLMIPAVTVTGTSGNPVIVESRYYWTTLADDTVSRPHESSSSPISLGTGPVTNRLIQVTQNVGTISVTTGSNAVVGSGTKFTQVQSTFAADYAVLYIEGVLLGVIDTIVDDTHLTLLNPVSTPSGSGAHFVAAPSRATHWNLYASESETSKVGLLLSENPLPLPRAGTITIANGASFGTTSVPTFYLRDIGARLYINNTFAGFIVDIGGQVEPSSTVAISTPWGFPTASYPYLASAMVYLDNSDWFGVSGNSLFQQINRPFRNDPPVNSSILAEHKYRLWRRRDTRPNFFSFSANEEVSATNNGSPYESNPGVDINTQSDIVNEDSYPDQSLEIRAMISHADALYIFTELQALPLFGETIDDFALSQVSAFNVGCAGPFAAISTPHGLVFMSNDRKVYLYPTANYPWKYVPQDVNVTEQLLEIGLPLRTVFSNIATTNLNNVRMTFYNFMTRDWLILAFTDLQGVVHNWIYDFVTKVWFELTPAFVSIVVYEFASGQKVLLGGGADGFVYVIDDLTGTYVANPNTLPAATFRPALVDFGDPDSKHVFRYLEFELTNQTLIQDITVSFWLDPQDVDNPGPPSRKITMATVKGANLFRGFPMSGGLCQRLLLSLDIQSSTNAGGFRSIKLVADKASSLIF